MEKAARQIERANHLETVEDYNQAIFAMKEQIKRLEGIVKEEEKVQQELGVIEQWFRSKLTSAKE